MHNVQPDPVSLMKIAAEIESFGPLSALAKRSGFKPWNK